LEVKLSSPTPNPSPTVEGLIMHPELINFSLFGLTVDISSYRFFMALAIVTATAGSYWMIKRSELDLKKALIILAVAILGFLVGSRMLNILINSGLYLAHPDRIYSLNMTGFSEYGGLMGAALAGFLMTRKFKLDVWRLGDLLAPNLGIGIAIMRIGCYLNGCCFGKETNLPWGVRFPLFSDAHMYELNKGTANLLSVTPVHPTEIYELIAALIGTAIALFILKKKVKPGIAVLGFLIWFTTFRLFNHLLRVMPNSFDAPAWFYPAFYVVIIILCVILLLQKFKSRNT